MKLTGITVAYGGSFNPPHMGHQMACLYLLEALGADCVWLMPAAQHPFGKILVDFSKRLQMCRIMAQPFGRRVEVSDVEADAGTSGKTYDTLTRLVKRFPERRFALAIGSDILQEVGQWHRWDDVKELVEVVVVGRAGYPNDDAGPVELPGLSSGEIRRMLRQGIPIEGLVPVGIADYIAEQQLYSAQVRAG
ncbi:MAG: nicotinate (nicotinamide) nucleotide adenylyltransferase [Deltaproteobacteria bacterium RIFOXYA12_FULL_58_15]|nr:MAG: nicotinate (nicotinamide) nucleotide adenylyltransferase [Deltaproteobacteria bacterium RIFOXYA12_FULL_58_15]OGR10198.1 MAG: nicotinate (nicotinamide) nucleotide adenylyltransferase [Deltaproteobacteria bacterium RIFOXYB12_FULL_58_9]